MNTALAMMALTAAKAISPATMSLGLCSRMRIARPRSAGSSMATEAARRRRRGLSSSSSNETALGTFLHLTDLMLWAGRGGQRRDVARRLINRRRECQGQRDDDGGPLVEPAVHGHLAAVQRDQALDDGQPEAGAFVAALIGGAGLEERIADPLEILRRNADAGVADAQFQPRSLDRGGDGDGAAALGELDGVGNQIEHDLLEGARIAGEVRQVVRRAGDEIDAVLARLEGEQIAAIDQRRTRRER